MRPHVAAMTGVSGIGKSTLLRKLSASLRFQHLQAGALIKEARSLTDGSNLSLDQLRKVDIDENQQLLIKGFVQGINLVEKLVVLDCHVLIERSDTLSFIDPSVFEAIAIDSMIFLVDDPSAIIARRLADTNRERPVSRALDLGIIQDRALAHGKEICRRLGIPIVVLPPTETASIASILQSY